MANGSRPIEVPDVTRGRWQSYPPHAERLLAAFHAQYGDARPTHVVAVPGRVNLIGEHLDYNLLPVLPMAIPRHVGLILRVRDDRVVRIASTAHRFGAREFHAGPEIEPYRAGDWGNYVKAAVQGIARQAGCERGFDAIVHSDIPVAEGLSSSSALVVAVGLAACAANGHSIARLDLADVLARAERYVGTAGGGMDQAVALCAERGAALRIDFDPLRVRPVALPGDWRFVVASSLAPAEKSGGARATYNRRTAECRRALALMLARVGRATPERSYRGLLAAWDSEELVHRAAKLLDEVLFRRFRHVITEATRVEAAVNAIEQRNLTTFGALLDASHASLRDDYQVSTPELDQLCEIARGAGAAGARLTGAGLGGSAVAVCDADCEAQVFSALERRFYAPGRPRRQLPYLFAAQPAGAAAAWTYRGNSR